MKTEITLTRKSFKLDKILDRLQQSLENQVRIGFFAEDVYEDGLQVATVAAWQDIGTKYIPPRPFMHVGLLRLLKSSPYLKTYGQLLQKIMAGKLTVNAAYSQIGSSASEDLKKIIKAWSEPPNSPITQRLKGNRNDPLVDTGKLMDSVKHKIGKSRKKQSKYKMRKMPTKVR